MKTPFLASNLARTWLTAGAVGSFATALLHLIIIFVGRSGYLYFGGSSLAMRSQQGSLAPALIMAAFAALFVLWGIYALSGAGVLGPLPFLRTVITAVTVLYILRGLVLIPDILRIAQGNRDPVCVRQAAFSVAMLAIGLAHAFGLLARGHRVRGA
jgi:hypothetical protein